MFSLIFLHLHRAEFTSEQSNNVYKNCAKVLITVSHYVQEAARCLAASLLEKFMLWDDFLTIFTRVTTMLWMTTEGYLWWNIRRNIESWKLDIVSLMVAINTVLAVRSVMKSFVFSVCLEKQYARMVSAKLSQQEQSRSHFDDNGSYKRHANIDTLSFSVCFFRNCMY